MHDARPTASERSAPRRPCALRPGSDCLTALVRRRPVAALLACGLAIAGVGISACGGATRGPEAFCGRLQRDRDVLVSGVVDLKTAKAAVDRYHDLDSVAPEAIRTEWHQLALLVKAAADVDPTVATAQQDLVQQAYSAAPAAATVVTYARQTCGVDLSAAVTTPATTAVTTGPTTTVAPPPPTSG